jgi:hypothetical protein
MPFSTPRFHNDPSLELLRSLVHVESIDIAPHIHFSRFRILLVHLYSCNHFFRGVGKENKNKETHLFTFKSRLV